MKENIRYSAAIIVRDNCEPRLSRFSVLAHQYDIQKRVVGLPYGVWSIGFATVNQIESVGVGFCSFMRQHY